MVRGGADVGKFRLVRPTSPGPTNAEADFTHSTVLRKHRQSSLRLRIISHHLQLSHAFQFSHFSSCMIFGSSLTCNR